MWEVREVKIRGRKIAYWTNGQKENPVVFFPGGPSSGKYITSYVENSHPAFSIIVVDYPGRGETDVFSECKTFKDVGGVIEETLLKITDKPLVLIGHSIGAAIAREVALTKLVKIKAVILIQPGEFIPVFWRNLLKVLFIPPNMSMVIRKVYWTVISKYLGIYEHDVVNENQYLSLLTQWNATLDYKIDNRICKTPTVIFNSDNDKIVDKSSIHKVISVFPNSVVKTFNGPHLYDYKKSWQQVADIIKSASPYYGLDFLKEILN